MMQNQSNRKSKIWNSVIILFSVIGLLACIAVLFPQVRRMIMDLAEQIMHKEASTYQTWVKSLLAYAIGGICFILFLDYCTQTESGRLHVRKVKREMKECLSEIDFRSFIKPVILMFWVYFLGILTIIRANFSYWDDVSRSVEGYRHWYDWSRYISEFFSIIIHGDTRLTDISPLPQLLAILVLAISSVLLVYIIDNKKITTVRLLASIPLGLSPYFLECLSYKFDAPYMALSILANIVPFLFIARKKAFLFCSVVSMLIMCLTYQAVSGIYMLIVLILCFQYWNNQTKSNKEILSFMGTAVIAFGFAMLLFKFFLMRPADTSVSYYTYNAIHPIPQILSGTFNNIKEYAIIINHDWGLIWKVAIALILVFFITQSMYRSSQKKIYSFFISILVIVFSFIFSYGIYSLLMKPLYAPRAMIGFGAFLAIICIYIVSDYKKLAVISVLVLNWCLFVFAFSYGNALADQARYAEFRINILLHDLGSIQPDMRREDLSFQIKNSIDFAPSVKNIAKHYPIIERLVPKRLGTEIPWDNIYILKQFNSVYSLIFAGNLDFDSLNLPVVLDSYYHTIKSDGNYILVILKQ